MLASTFISYALEYWYISFAVIIVAVGLLCYLFVQIIKLGKRMKETSDLKKAWIRDSEEARKKRAERQKSFQEESERAVSEDKTVQTDQPTLSEEQSTDEKPQEVEAKEETETEPQKEETRSEETTEEDETMATKKEPVVKAETKTVKKEEIKKVEAEQESAAKSEIKAVYRVVYDKENREWLIRKDGATRVIRRVKTKAEALELATQFAENQELNITVQKKDGKFQKKTNYRSMLSGDKMDK